MQRSMCRVMSFVIGLLILTTPSAKMEAAWTLDKVSSAVVLLSQPLPDSRRHIGTGILMVHDAHPFLVTAEHMAKVLTPAASVTWRGAGDRPIVLMLGRIAGAITKDITRRNELLLFDPVGPIKAIDVCRASTHLGADVIFWRTD